MSDLLWQIAAAAAFFSPVWIAAAVQWASPRCFDLTTRLGAYQRRPERNP